MAVNYRRWLRSYVGHQRLLQITTAALIRDDLGRILLGRRSDVMLWAFPGGSVELGETPADTIVREVAEETGLWVVPERLIGLYTGPDFAWTYPNGDQAELVVAFFACRAVGGHLMADGDETLSLRFFATNELPALLPRCVRMLQDALADQCEAFFD